MYAKILAINGFKLQYAQSGGRFFITKSPSFPLEEMTGCFYGD